MIKRSIIKIVDWLYLPFIRRYIPIQTFRYGVTGGANMVFDALLYFVTFNYILCKKDLDLGLVVISPQIASYFLVFPIVFLTGLWLAKNITFQNSPLKDSTQRVRYLAVTTANIIIKYGGIKALVAIGIFPSISNAMMTVVTVIFSYLMQNYFTFKGNHYE